MSASDVSRVAAINFTAESAAPRALMPAAPVDLLSATPCRRRTPKPTRRNVSAILTTWPEFLQTRRTFCSRQGTLTRTPPERAPYRSNGTGCKIAASPQEIGSRRHMVTRHLRRRFWQVPETVGALFRTRTSHATSNPTLDGQRRRQVQAAQTRLLYENANVGIVVTVVIASLLAYAQWDVVSPAVAWAWLLYMLLVSAARSLIVRRYWRAPAREARRQPLARRVRRRRGAGGGRLGGGGHRPATHLPGR